jgi:hypothetical protein
MALWDEDTHRFVPLPGWCWLDKILMPELHYRQQQQQSGAGVAANFLLEGSRHHPSIPDASDVLLHRDQHMDQHKAPTSK